MSEQPSSPSPDQRPRESVLELAWRNMANATPQHLELETLAAYTEGGLPDALREACEEHLARCPDCLDLLLELTPESAAPMVVPMEQPRPKRQTMRWLLAASLLFGLSAGGWGAWQYARTEYLRREIAIRECELAEAESQLGAVHKEDFLTMANTPIGNYWCDWTKPRILQASARLRGPERLSPEALEHAAQARLALEQLVRLPGQKGLALLELASINIASKQLDKADEQLR